MAGIEFAGVIFIRQIAHIALDCPFVIRTELGHQIHRQVRGHGKSRTRRPLRPREVQTRAQAPPAKPPGRLQPEITRVLRRALPDMRATIEENI